jgi:hypothetical protein
MAAPEKYRKMFGKEKADKIMKRGMGAFFSGGSRPGQTVRKADADLVKTKKKG